MRLSRSDIILAVEHALSDPAVRKATKFVAPDFIVRVTRQRKPRANARSHTLILTFGKPNFRERAFVKACLEAAEPFPVKKVQLKFYP